MDIRKTLVVTVVVGIAILASLSPFLIPEIYDYMGKDFFESTLSIGGFVVLLYGWHICGSEE